MAGDAVERLRALKQTQEATWAVRIAKCWCFAGCGGTVGWSVAVTALARQPSACPVDSGDATRGGGCRSGFGVVAAGVVLDY